LNNKKTDAKNDLPFEKALDMLERIAAELEGGTLGLEESLKRYEEGIKYARLCQGKLQEAERKIEILQKADNGIVQKNGIQIKDAAGEIEDDEDVQGSLL